jgi:hypothetical protein
MIDAPVRSTIAGRVAASLIGGYAFVFGFSTLAVALGVAAGMPYAEAQGLAYLLAFLVFLVCFLWAFAARSVTRVWTLLAGGGVLMTVAGALLSRALT